MHNIWVSRTSTTILILKCQIVLAGENRVDDGQFWILRGFLNYWEILGCVKQADWASFHLLFLIIFTLSEFPCAKSCPGASLLPRSNLFAWGNWGRVILTRKRRGHMLHANERATAQSRQIFFFPCPRHFCCCLTGFPGDLDQHFHNRVSSLTPPPSHPRAAWGAGQAPGCCAETAQPRFLPFQGEGEDAAGGCKGSAPPSTEFTLSQADSRDLPGEKLARGHQPGQPHSRFVVLRY